MTAVALDRLTKRFGAVTAVAEASFAVEAAELVTVLGPSGCGKTTTLRLIAGFLRPSSGTVSIGGRVANDDPPHRREIGLVFQNFALFPHMTVRENIGFGLRMRAVAKDEQRRRIEEALTLVRLNELGERYPRQLSGGQQQRVALARAVAKDEQRRRIEEALALVRLSELAERYPRQLSGGQQQRVALARALVIRPALLLLDEPFGALDKQLREHMQGELAALQGRLGIPTLFVTHDQEEALRLSDRIVVMKGGRIAQIGTPQDIYERPRTSFVAEFMGRSNLFAARLLGGGDRRAMIEINGLRVEAEADGFAAGESVRVLMRPEQLRLHAAGANPAGGFYPGTVTSMVYLGATLSYRVSLQNGGVVEIEQQNPGQGAGLGVAEGSAVLVEIPRSAIYLIRDDSARASEHAGDGPQ